MSARNAAPSPLGVPKRKHPNRRPEPPRLALRRDEAAAALGVSVDVFDEHVRDELPVVRLASVKVFPVAGIEAWLAANATSLIEDVTG